MEFPYIVFPQYVYNFIIIDLSCHIKMLVIEEPGMIHHNYPQEGLLGVSVPLDECEMAGTCPVLSDRIVPLPLNILQVSLL